MVSELQQSATSKKAASDGFSKIPKDELNRLLALRHRDPHSILGAHLTPTGVIVRAFRPGAERVNLLVDGEPPRPMRARPEPGLFEVIVANKREVFPYRLEVHFPGGAAITAHSAYSFLPTLGELDLYLLAEGKHEQAYKKLGAHPMESQGVQGVAFAVWAPNADGVSVVGDFNGWDGRLDMMRMLGGSGIWEVFVPELAPGTRYKYEIRTREGALMLKTDPFATWMEVPPSTASIVYKLSQPFSDDAWMKQRSARDQLRSPVSIYEVHLGSWRRNPGEGNRSLTYREMAHESATTSPISALRMSS